MFKVSIKIESYRKRELRREILHLLAHYLDCHMPENVPGQRQKLGFFHVTHTGDEEQVLGRSCADFPSH